MRPLEGIKVIDFTQAYAGPFTSLHFGDLGADVIKIEPLEGDSCRWWTPLIGEESAYFAFLNRNKKSVRVNLKAEEGKKIIMDLVKEADVVLENMASGTMNRLGLGYEDMKKVNPKIVYGSLNGYGSVGPFATYKCYDNIASGYSGVLSASGDPEGEPCKLGIALGDCYPGSSLFTGVMVALYHARKTGEGQRVEIAMMDALFGLMDKQILEYSVDHVEPNRKGNAHTQYAPEDILATKDGYVALSVVNEEMWKTFCKTLGKEEWIDDSRFSTNKLRKENYPELKKLIEDEFQKYGKLELEKMLMPAGVACAASMKVSDMVNSPQYIERNMIRYQNDVLVGNLLTFGIPFKFSDTACNEIQSSRILDTDTKAELLRLGYSEDKIDELRKNNVI